MFDKNYLRQYARQVAAKYGLPPALADAQIGQESSWNPNAKSPAGALGIAQFMPGTGKMYGLKTTSDFLDPIKSLDAWGAHMNDLVRQNGGNIQLALAAYNAGQGAVNKYGGVPPYRETQDYVKKITGNMGGAQASLPIGQSEPALSTPQVSGFSPAQAAIMPDNPFAPLDSSFYSSGPINPMSSPNIPSAKMPENPLANLGQSAYQKAGITPQISPQYNWGMEPQMSAVASGMSPFGGADNVVGNMLGKGGGGGGKGFLAAGTAGSTQGLGAGPGGEFDMSKFAWDRMPSLISMMAGLSDRKQGAQDPYQDFIDPNNNPFWRRFQ